MKRVLLTTCLAIGTFLVAFGQEEIEGIWLAGEGKTKVEIFSANPGLYTGKIVWIDVPENKKGRIPTDRKNPNKALRSRPLMGLSLLEDLAFEDGKWVGTIYTPKHGRTLPAILTLNNNDELIIEVSVMGMTREKKWTRTVL